MISSLFRLLAAPLIAALVLSGAAFAQENAPKEVKTATHGDWEIICVEGTEFCRMEQFGKNSENKRALVMSLQRVSGLSSDGSQVPAIVSFIAPLRVALRFGLQGSIDNAEPRNYPFERCSRLGCVASLPAFDDAIGRLKKGSKLVVSFVFDKPQPEKVAISLRGFTKAYNSLKPIPTRRGE